MLKLNLGLWICLCHKSMLIRLIGHLIRNLSYATINTEQTTKMSSEIKRILIDLSGTLHIEDAAIPDSIESLNRYTQNKEFLL